MLSRCFKDSGFDILAVDHSKNRFLPMARICQVDLTKQHGWDFLNYVIKFHNVVFVHAAPPCGTCSRAREIKLAGQCPQPLRSEAQPWGLPDLAPGDQARVDSANSIYKGLGTFFEACSLANIHWSVENPERSLLWSIPPIKALVAKACFYLFLYGVGIDLPGKPSFPPCLGFASCKPLALACPSNMCTSPMVELDPQVVRCNMQLPRRLLILSRCALRLSALCSKGLTCFPCVWFCRMGP